MAFLGDTLAEIAMHKAGILKKGCLAVSAAQEVEAEAVLKEQCVQMGVSLQIVDKNCIKEGRSSLKGRKFSYKKYKQMELPLLGTYQLENAALALEALDLLACNGVKIKEENIRAGFGQSKWPGRFQILNRKPYVIADGAHNEDAVKKLMETMRFYFTNERIIYIMGVLKDKEYGPMIELSAQKAEYIFTVTPPNKERALSAFDLAKEIKEYNPNVTATDSVEEALEMAMLMAGEDGVVLAFGSLSYLGGLQRCFEKSKKQS